MTVVDEETKDDVADLYEIDDNAPMTPDDEDEDTETKSDADNTAMDGESDEPSYATTSGTARSPPTSPATVVVESAKASLAWTVLWTFWTLMRAAVNVIECRLSVIHEMLIAVSSCNVDTPRILSQTCRCFHRSCH